MEGRRLLGYVLRCADVREQQAEENEGICWTISTSKLQTGTTPRKGVYV
jgi:hypothetical protein